MAFYRSLLYKVNNISPDSSHRSIQTSPTQTDKYIPELDQSINIQYILAKILYYTFSSSPNLARSEPAIPYDSDQIGDDVFSYMPLIYDSIP
jgi:hypothetical protein